MQEKTSDRLSPASLCAFFNYNSNYLFFFFRNSFCPRVLPPSHRTSTPARYPLRSSAREAIAKPSSSGFPILLSQEKSIRYPPCSFSAAPMPVAISPGLKETTRIPFFPRLKADFAAYQQAKFLERA